MYWVASGLEQKSQCEMSWCRFDVYTYPVTIEAHSLPKLYEETIKHQLINPREKVANSDSNMGKTLSLMATCQQYAGLI